MFGAGQFNIGVFVCLAIGSATSDQAFSHDWYPKECCSGLDCAPSPRSEFEPVKNGWRVLRTGEVIPYDQIRRSRDGEFHRCLTEFWEPESATRCLFVPDLGS